MELVKPRCLRTLAGLQPPLAGQRLTVPRIRSLMRLAFRRVEADADGYVENLTFWASVFGTNDIQPALDAFALNELADRHAGNLSAGQKRRLGLARMLVTGRPIWMLDEPTVSLDRNAVADVRQRLCGAHLETGWVRTDRHPYRPRPGRRGSGRWSQQGQSPNPLKTFDGGFL